MILLISIFHARFLTSLVTLLLTQLLRDYRYSCNGRCGAGCSGAALGNAYTQDCFTHDICSYFENASGGARYVNVQKTHDLGKQDTHGRLCVVTPTAAQHSRQQKTTFSLAWWTGAGRRIRQTQRLLPRPARLALELRRGLLEAQARRAEECGYGRSGRASLVLQPGWTKRRWHACIIQILKYDGEWTKKKDESHAVGETR